METVNPGILSTAIIKDQRLAIDFWYPEIDGQVNEIQIGLSSVRAADSILISYDFERDGYSIKQASIFEFDETNNNPDWQEVAFVKAWAREP